MQLLHQQNRHCDACLHTDCYGPMTQVAACCIGLVAAPASASSPAPSPQCVATHLLVTFHDPNSCMLYGPGRSCISPIATTITIIFIIMTMRAYIDLGAYLTDCVHYHHLHHYDHHHHECLHRFGCIPYGVIFTTSKKRSV